MLAAGEFAVWEFAVGCTYERFVRSLQTWNCLVDEDQIRLHFLYNDCIMEIPVGGVNGPEADVGRIDLRHLDDGFALVPFSCR